MAGKSQNSIIVFAHSCKVMCLEEFLHGVIPFFFFKFFFPLYLEHQNIREFYYSNK